MMLWLRSLLFNIVLVGLTLIMGVLCAPATCWPDRAAPSVLKLWARLSLAALRLLVGIRIEARGFAPLPHGPVIVAPKHESALDILLMLALLDRPVFVLKQELTSMPIIGWYARRAGYLIVDRAGAANSMRGLLRASKTVAAKGRPICIFPEGTRVPPGASPPLKPGVLGLVGQLRAIVVPIAIRSGHCWPRESFLKFPGIVSVSMLPPLAPDMARSESLAALHDAINALKATKAAA